MKIILVTFLLVVEFLFYIKFQLLGGNMCVGGGSIPIGATKWFLNKANNGDVVMLIPDPLHFKERKKYFDYAKEWCKFSDVPINSVTAIVVNSPEFGYLSEVLEIVARAEAVYFTGGDQKNFWLFIKDSPLENLLNNLIKTKRIVIGNN
jgi:cyanophycinase-like exopeptidase